MPRLQVKHQSPKLPRRQRQQRYFNTLHSSFVFQSSYHVADLKQGQSALETLPTEIFHLILNNLDTHAGLAIKFVSRTIHNKTIRSNGEPVVDLKTGPRNDYSQAVCLIESHGSFRKKFQLLTCFVCGERKANSFDGFCDNMFDKCLVVRYCLVCLAKSYKGRIPPGHKVEGELVFKCCGCAQYVSLIIHSANSPPLTGPQEFCPC